MSYHSYGIIGEDGPIENVTITSPTALSDVDIAEQVAAHHEADIEKTLVGVHHAEMRKRFAMDGATETRYFPKEVG